MTKEYNLIKSRYHNSINFVSYYDDNIIQAMYQLLIQIAKIIITQLCIIMSKDVIKHVYNVFNYSYNNYSLNSKQLQVQ